MKSSFLSRVGIVLVALVAVASAPAVQAQTATNVATISDSFPTIPAGSQSNLLYQAASGLNITPTATRLRNSPVGIDVVINATLATNALAVQSVYGFQLGYADGTWANNMLLAVIPAGVGISNITFRTNFSQAVIGNATQIRTAQRTNGNAVALVTGTIRLHNFQ